MKNYYVSSSMRIIMALVFCCTGISKAIAQEENREYVPFVEEGKVWYCNTHSFIGKITPEHPEGEGIVCTYTMRGDSLINGMEYKKVYCQYEDYYGDIEQHYYCAVREEDFLIYIIENGMTEEKLLYDFSRSGEIISMTYNDYKFARTDGWYRPWGNFLPGQLEFWACRYSGEEVDFSHNSTVWYDGVGAVSYNPFSFELYPLIYIEPTMGKHLAVRTCMKDGKYIFSSDWMVAMGSVNDISNMSNPPIGSHIYDLQGHRLTDSPTKGIYIQNGKKVMVK